MNSIINLVGAFGNKYKNKINKMECSCLNIIYFN